VEKDKESGSRKIRSELTHEQEVSLVHSLVPWDTLQRIDASLKALEQQALLKTKRSE